MLKRGKKTGIPGLFIAQFKSPIIIILIIASALSYYLQDPVDATIIMVIVFFSGVLGFWQEYGASNAVEKLLSIVRIKCNVLRNGIEKEVPFDETVPGDIVILNAGDGIPGDCLVLESKDLFVDEATLTGETYPVEKSPQTLPPDTPLSHRTNALFMGTHVVSGSAKAVIVNTGPDTELGGISEHMRHKPPETDFERGVRRFGYLLMEVTLLLIMAIFAINVYLNRPVLESFIFALALAVGLTPQLLPAIISINLAQGARQMATKKVIVKQLSSIENFGTMNILCSDKTGTITEGKVRVHSTVDINGRYSEKVLFYAYLNSFYETSFSSPIDDAVRNHKKFDVSSYRKVDEVPYDFERKRLSILVATDGTHIMITKGAIQNVLGVCTTVEMPGTGKVSIRDTEEQISKKYKELSSQGFRTLGIAYKDLGPVSVITKNEETGMTFLGFLILSDRPKPGIAETIATLNSLGVSLKMFTGDNKLVAESIGKQVGLSARDIITGPELNCMSDQALMIRCQHTNIFAEVEPNQKERVIIALKRVGNVVGYIGDGINDAPALHAADVGISVDTAVDVAKDAAVIVLMENDLNVLVNGVEEGRRTFANTLKYVFMATSANFGNMFSMAGASLILPFLPLLPTQILLTNLLTDFPEMAIAKDQVDKELVEKPRRWDIDFIRKFMVTFGIISSVFDFLTFGILVFMLHASVGQFRTGWFMESVISASFIVLIIRTRRPFFQSRPGKYLFIATVLVILGVIAFPYTPIGEIFQFTPLPVSFIAVLGLILLLYMLLAEMVKRLFYSVVRY